MFPAEPPFKGDDLKHEVLTAATGSSIGVTSMIVVGAGSGSGALALGSRGSQVLFRYSTPSE